jgi:hypothetical protein
LARNGDLESRVAGAAAILMHIESADVPGALVSDLVGLKTLLFDTAQ